MQQIFGLILKDILQIKFYRKNLILSLVFYSIFIFVQSANSDITSIGTVLIMMIFSLMSTTTFAYDEKTKADAYIPTLPVNRKQIVISKYLLSVLLLLVGMIVGLIISTILAYLATKQLPNLIQLLSSVIGGVIGLSFLQCIQIPCIYKWGAEKGRVQVYIVIMVIVGLITGIYMLFPNILDNFTFLSKISNFLPLIAVFISLLMYFISYKISYKIYRKKEL